MPSPKVSAARGRPVKISCLAAKLLGHTRVAGTALSTKYLSNTFPTFNALELANALDELLEKQLVKQKGPEDHATYSLTDYGREGRIAVA